MDKIEFINRYVIAIAAERGKDGFVPYALIIAEAEQMWNLLDIKGYAEKCAF